jgi:O-antigen ligase
MKNWIALALLAVCILAAGMTIKETSRYGALESELSKALAGGYSSGSLGQRLELWRLSGCIADEYPVLGAGTGSFKHAQLDHWPATCGVEIRASKGYFSQAHSVYFQSLATMGYLGLTALMLVLVILLCVAIRFVPSGGLVLLFMVSSFMVAGFTVDLFFKDFMVARFVLLTSLGLACLQNDDTCGLKGVP